MYIILIKKAVYAHNSSFFCKGRFILLQLYGSKDKLFEDNLFWVGQYDPPSPSPSNFILEEELIRNNTIIQILSILSNLPKLIRSQKIAGIILQMLTSLVFL